VIVSLIDVTKGIKGVELFIFGIALVIEKAISVYHANHFIKEFIPKEKDIVPAT